MLSLSCCKVTVLNRGPDPMVPMLRWPGAPPRAHRMTLQVPRAYFLLSLTQAPVQMRNVPRSSSLQMSSEPVGRALRSGPRPHQGTLRVQHPPREGTPSCWKSSCNFLQESLAYLNTSEFIARFLFLSNMSFRMIESCVKRPQRTPLQPCGLRSDWHWHYSLLGFLSVWFYYSIHFKLGESKD